MPNENGSHDTPTLDIWCQMVHNRTSKQTTTQEVKMNITITDKDVAKSIATEIEQATGTQCEVFSNDTGSVIIYDHTVTVARITTLSSVIDVAPLAGPFRCENTDIPLAMQTLNGIKEIAHALDTATSHVLNAALNH